MIKTIKKNVILDNKFFLVENNEVLFERTNKKGTHLKINHHNKIDYGMVILAITKDKKIYIHREFRYAVNKLVCSIIKGGGESDKDLIENVNMELREEAGLKTDCIEVVSTNNHENASIIDCPIYFIIAKNCEYIEQKLEDEENIVEQYFLTEYEVKELLKNNGVDDAASQALIRRYFLGY